jgi:hypothetical protein
MQRRRMVGGLPAVILICPHELIDIFIRGKNENYTKLGIEWRVTRVLLGRLSCGHFYLLVVEGHISHNPECTIEIIEE